MLSPIPVSPVVLRAGAIVAILGAVISVAAGVGFGGLTAIPGIGAEAVLGAITSRPTWFWPLVHLGFIVGAFLWMAAFVVVAGTVGNGANGVLAFLALAAAVVGVAAHAVDSSISGVALSALATAGRASPDAIASAEAVLLVLDGTWAAVITFFHGLPFILLGLAVTFNDRYPAWLGWIGIIGGTGSMITGLALFVRLGWPTTGFIAFALVISVWMVFLGVALWRSAAAETTAYVEDRSAASYGSRPTDGEAP